VASTYRPPAIVVDIALNRDAPYENRERKHLHNTADVMPARPVEGSIDTYTYWTPQYAIGCVQRQDRYPDDCGGKWYAHHEQHEWDLSFATRTDARIFTHHPGARGPEHGYWTGDIRCGCGHFFGQRNVVLALYDIPPGEPYQFIHAYVPREAFDQVVDEGGWIFVRAGPACAGLKLLGGHRWTVEGEWRGVELVSPGARNGAVCEVGQVTPSRPFEEFRRQVMDNDLSFDREAMSLRYRSSGLGTLRMDTRGRRELDGEQVELAYPTYESPYMHSAWDSGVIELRIRGKRSVLAFVPGFQRYGS
jgi:hypothetical protein